MSSSDVSAVTSHFFSPNEGFTTTTSGPVTSGSTTIGLTSVTGLTNASVFVGIVEPGGTKEQTFTGIVDTSGLQLTGVKWTRGTNVDHASGVTIVDYVSGTGPKMMTKGLLVEHTQAGLHALTSSSTLTSSKFITGLNDTNGNELFKVTATASAVNEFTVANAATGSGPVLSATGGDTDVGITITPKGAGKLTLNNLFNPYKFHAYRNAASSPSNNTAIVCDTKVFDTGTNYSTADGKFTAPITGFYFFSGQISLLPDSSAHFFAASLWKNGVATGGMRGVQLSGTTNALAPSVNGLLSLTAGDYVQLVLEANNSGANLLNVGVNAELTWFSGFILSVT